MPTGNGGGAYNTGSLTLNGSSLFVGNTAPSIGGGIYNANLLVLSGHASIRGNSASYGGGVYNLYSLTLSGSGSITGNSAGVEGGGVYNEQGILVGLACAPVVDANVHDNTPDDCFTPVRP